PAARYPDMNALAADLAALLGEPAPAAAPPRPRVEPAAVRFAFAGPRFVPPPALEGRDTLHLDVGDDLRVGVIDHHHLPAYSGSTTGLVLVHPGFVDQAAGPGRRPDDPFTVVTHERPDLDSVAAAYLALARLASGRFPPGAEALGA